MERGSEERTIGLETILEDEPSEDLLTSRLEPRSTVEGMKNRNFGKVAFAAMLVVGLTLLWISSKLSQIVSLEDLAMLQQTISRAGFTDWQKIALMAICAFAIALLVRRSRVKMRLRLISMV